MTDSIDNSSSTTEGPASPEGTEVGLLPMSPRGEFFQQYAWLAFLGPLIVYMLVPMFFGASPPGDHLTEEHREAAQQAYANSYLWQYTTMASLLVALVIYLPLAIRLPKFRISALAIAVGVVGVVLWVGIDAVGIKSWLVGLFGEESWAVTILGLAPRDAFNPIEQFGAGTPRFWWFLTVRFIGLALIVPVVEELMLRGWLMRFVDNPAFWQVPFGEVTLRAAAIGIGFEVLIHPEKLAALVWFSLTTWLMFKTKNFWDCVAAHAVTNFLLGVWVVWRGEWHLW
ncbi:MAG: CAAX prenyl protease-related protein [Planctomycetota bacterium]